MQKKFRHHAVFLEDMTARIIAMREELEALREQLTATRTQVRKAVDASRQHREQRNKKR